MQDEQLTIGRCYLVAIEGKSYVMKLEGRSCPNSQGMPGTDKWIGVLICVPDGGPLDDGQHVDLASAAIIKVATKQEIVARCIGQGWRDAKEIDAYLQCYGIAIKPSTLGVYVNALSQSQGTVRRRSSRVVSEFTFGLADLELLDGMLDRFGGQKRFKEFLRFVNLAKSRGANGRKRRQDDEHSG